MKSLMLEEPAYQLIHNVERFIHYETDYGHDLKIENVSREDDLKIFDEVPFNVPKPILYSGYFPILETVDFPVAENAWIVVSKKMLDVLNAVGTFPHLEFMTTVVDSCITKDNWYSFKGNLRDEITVNKFITLQLTEHLDIFNYEKSKYTLCHDSSEGGYRYIKNPKEYVEGSFIHDVEEYVFNIPKNGLPPLFHVNGLPTTLFVSSQARMALKEAGITGIKYYSLKGIRWGAGMFVDVPTPIANEATNGGHQ